MDGPSQEAVGSWGFDWEDKGEHELDDAFSAEHREAWSFGYTEETGAQFTSVLNGEAGKPS